MSKISRRQQSLAYYAQAVIEWRAKGWGSASINRMLICALEGTRSVHINPTADAVIVLEIADGVRCA
jgi:hypothetical protein